METVWLQSPGNSLADSVARTQISDNTTALGKQIQYILRNLRLIPDEQAVRVEECLNLLLDTLFAYAGAVSTSTQLQHEIISALGTLLETNVKRGCRAFHVIFELSWKDQHEKRCLCLDLLLRHAIKLTTQEHCTLVGRCVAEVLQDSIRTTTEILNDTFAFLVEPIRQVTNEAVSAAGYELLANIIDTTADIVKRNPALLEFATQNFPPLPLLQRMVESNTMPHRAALVHFMTVAVNNNLYEFTALLASQLMQTLLNYIQTLTQESQLVSILSIIDCIATSYLIPPGVRDMPSITRFLVERDWSVFGTATRTAAVLTTAHLSHVALQHAHSEDSEEDERAAALKLHRILTRRLLRYLASESISVMTCAVHAVHSLVQKSLSLPDIHLYVEALAMCIEQYTSSGTCEPVALDDVLCDGGSSVSMSRLSSLIPIAGVGAVMSSASTSFVTVPPSASSALIIPVIFDTLAQIRHSYGDDAMMRVYALTQMYAHKLSRAAPHSMCSSSSDAVCANMRSGDNCDGSRSKTSTATAMTLRTLNALVKFTFCAPMNPRRYTFSAGSPPVSPRAMYPTSPTVVSPTLILTLTHELEHIPLHLGSRSQDRAPHTSSLRTAATSSSSAFATSLKCNFKSIDSNNNNTDNRIDISNHDTHCYDRGAKSKDTVLDDNDSESGTSVDVLVYTLALAGTLQRTHHLRDAASLMFHPARPVRAAAVCTVTTLCRSILPTPPLAIRHASMSSRSSPTVLLSSPTRFVACPLTPTPTQEQQQQEQHRQLQQPTPSSSCVLAAECSPDASPLLSCSSMQRVSSAEMCTREQSEVPTKITQPMNATWDGSSRLNCGSMRPGEVGSMGGQANDDGPAVQQRQRGVATDAATMNTESSACSNNSEDSRVGVPSGSAGGGYVGENVADDIHTLRTRRSHSNENAPLPLSSLARNLHSPCDSHGDYSKGESSNAKRQEAGAGSSCVWSEAGGHGANTHAVTLNVQTSSGDDRVSRAMRSVLQVALSDRDERIRWHALHLLNSGCAVFDSYLCVPESLEVLVMISHDVVKLVQDEALRLLCRLRPLNPKFVLPELRCLQESMLQNISLANSTVSRAISETTSLCVCIRQDSLVLKPSIVEEVALRNLKQQTVLCRALTVPQLYLLHSILDHTDDQNHYDIALLVDPVLNIIHDANSAMCRCAALDTLRAVLTTLSMQSSAIKYAIYRTCTRIIRGEDSEEQSVINATMRVLGTIGAVNPLKIRWVLRCMEKDEMGDKVNKVVATPAVTLSRPRIRIHPSKTDTYPALVLFYLNKALQMAVEPRQQIEALATARVMLQGLRSPKRLELLIQLLPQLRAWLHDANRVHLHETILQVMLDLTVLLRQCAEEVRQKCGMQLMQSVQECCTLPQASQKPLNVALTHLLNALAKCLPLQYVRQHHWAVHFIHRALLLSENDLALLERVVKSLESFLAVIDDKELHLILPHVLQRLEPLVRVTDSAENSTPELLPPRQPSQRVHDTCRSDVNTACFNFLHAVIAQRHVPLLRDCCAHIVHTLVEFIECSGRAEEDVDRALQTLAALMQRVDQPALYFTPMVTAVAQAKGYSADYFTELLHQPRAIPALPMTHLYTAHDLSPDQLLCVVCDRPTLTQCEFEKEMLRGLRASAADLEVISVAHINHRTHVTFRFTAGTNQGAYVNVFARKAREPDSSIHRNLAIRHVEPCVEPPRAVDPSLLIAIASTPTAKAKKREQSWVAWMHNTGVRLLRHSPYATLRCTAPAADRNNALALDLFPFAAAALVAHLAPADRAFLIEVFNGAVHKAPNDIKQVLFAFAEFMEDERADCRTLVMNNYKLVTYTLERSRVEQKFGISYDQDPVSGGVMVIKLAPHGLGARAGVPIGAHLIAINDTPVQSVSDISGCLEGVTRVKLTVRVVLETRHRPTQQALMRVEALASVAFVSLMHSKAIYYNEVLFRQLCHDIYMRNDTTSHDSAGSITASKEQDASCNNTSSNNSSGGHGGLDSHAQTKEGLARHALVAAERLIEFYGHLNLNMEASGLVTVLQRDFDNLIVPDTFPCEENSALEQLHWREEALTRYEGRIYHPQTGQLDAAALLGALRCYAAMGKMDVLREMIAAHWSKLDEAGQRRILPLRAKAAFYMRQWEEFDEITGEPAYEEHLDIVEHCAALFRTHRYTDLLQLTQSRREALLEPFAESFNESYNRAYDSLAELQHLTHFEELISFTHSSPERRSMLTRLWHTRLQQMSSKPASLVTTVSINALVLSSQEDLLSQVTVIRALTLVQWYALAEHILAPLVGPCRDAAALRSLEPEVVYAYMKYVCVRGDVTESYELLRDILHPPGGTGGSSNTSSSRHSLDVTRVRPLYASSSATMSATTATNAHPLSTASSSASSDLVVASTATNTALAAEAGAGAAHSRRDKAWSSCWLLLGELTIRAHPDRGKEAIAYLLHVTTLNPRNSAAFHSLGILHYDLAHVPSLAPHDRTEHFTAAVVSFVQAVHLCTDGGPNSAMQDVVRILSIWFANSHVEEINAAVRTGTQKLPSRVWLNVIPQLIARIGITAMQARRILSDLLVAVGTAYPQALLYPLTVAEKSPDLVRRVMAAQVLCGIRPSNLQVVEAVSLISNEMVRIAILRAEKWHEAIHEAAQKQDNGTAILQILRPLYDELRVAETPNERQFETVLGQLLQHAYNALRENDVDRTWTFLKQVYMTLEKMLLERRMNICDVSPTLDGVRHSIVTVPGTFTPNTTPITIEKFRPYVHIMPSKQRPRRFGLDASDGHKYHFLIKGHEDMRQDERIMQIIGIVNNIFASEAGTSAISLAITQYAVIPLSENVGIVGWVENSDTIYKLLESHRVDTGLSIYEEVKLALRYGGVGTVADYHRLPKHIRKTVLLRVMHATADDELSRIMWKRNDTCEEWLSYRSTYGHTLAAMSMVGYVLGLGDRHLNNLMLEGNGSVVHIDFGDCFEVAMMRTVFAEMVPFRLTRLLVRALGITGVDGVFRITSELVMTNLRKHSENLLSLLEAFIYDPLINWRFAVSENERLTASHRPSNSETAVAVASAAAAAAATPECHVDKLSVLGVGSAAGIARGAEAHEEMDDAEALAQRIAALDLPQSATADIAHMQLSHTYAKHYVSSSHLQQQLQQSQADVETRNEQADLALARVKNKLTGQDFDQSGSSFANMWSSCHSDTGTCFNADAYNMINKSVFGDSLKESVDTALLTSYLTQKGLQLTDDHCRNVPHQVDRLILEATSIDNLAEAYLTGWAPFW